MTFLTPTELRTTLKISRSTEHRLLKNGMPSIGAGRLRRYEEEAAVEWFRTYAHQATTSKNMLAPGDYRCACGFEGTLEKATTPGPCPRCGSREMPGRVTLHPLPM
jgi:predicted Zn-ribbon and HTH transcriptional regulator